MQKYCQASTEASAPVVLFIYEEIITCIMGDMKVTPDQKDSHFQVMNSYCQYTPVCEPLDFPVGYCHHTSDTVVPSIEKNQYTVTNYIASLAALCKTQTFSGGSSDTWIGSIERSFWMGRMYNRPLPTFCFSTRRSILAL